MPTNNSLNRQLTKSISIEIVPVDGRSKMNERVWAINWFDFKHKWLYNLYNRLASKYVVQVGGQLLFKGYHKKTLVGSSKLARQTLLIVTYPKIDDFLNMLMIKAFQMVSLLRVKAVKDFVFGFTERMDSYEYTSTPKYGNEKYLVFHFQGGVEGSAIIELAAQNGIKIYFYGKKLAEVQREEAGKDPVKAPFFMDGIMVFEALSENKLEEFATSKNFNVLIRNNSTNYAAIFARDK